MNFTVNLVGAGNMGGALLRGWIAGGMASQKARVIDPSPSDAMLAFLTEQGIAHFAVAEDASPGDVLMLAVKPQMMAAALPDLKPLVSKDTVAVSVAAGTTLAGISSLLGDIPIVRTMPNTPSLVGRGMTVACPNANVTAQHKAQVSALLAATGKLEWVDDEVLIDAVTAVSGSGPAYAFYLAECMAAAGVKAGLPQDLAVKLARETVAGAGELLYRSEEEPGQLRKNVTSPGGTTAAALEVLMAEDGMEVLLTRAVAAAAKRSRELS